MTTVVNWVKVFRHLASQGEVLDHQIKAAERLNDAVVRGKPIGEAMQAFTQDWRSDPIVTHSTKPKTEEYYKTLVPITLLEQPDALTCQSASVASVLGLASGDIPKIRRALLELGQPGSPQVMSRYMANRLGNRYKLHLNASLSQVVDWLQDGEALITHGWHTNSGHVFVICGVDFDETTGLVRFLIFDPYGNFDLQNWRFVPGTRSYYGWMSALGIYSLCVVPGGVSASRHAYRNGDVNMTEPTMWVHRVLPEAGQATAKPAKVTPAKGVKPADTSQSNASWYNAIVRAAKRLGVTPEDVATICQIESSFRNVIGGSGNQFAGYYQFGRAAMQDLRDRRKIPGNAAKGLDPRNYTFEEQTEFFTENALLPFRGYKPGAGVRALYNAHNLGNVRANGVDGFGTPGGKTAKLNLGSPERLAAAKKLKELAG